MTEFPFMQTHDVIVAGAGLAGACAAFALSRDSEVLVLEADQPGAGASGTAAGLVNPLMGKRVRKVWRMEESLDALSAIIDEAGCPAVFRQEGVWRPALSSRQAATFREAADVLPAHATWTSAESFSERFPDARARLGALYVVNGGAINVEVLIDCLLEAAERRGAVVLGDHRLITWKEENQYVYAQVHTRGGDEFFRAGRLVLAPGQGYPAIDELSDLPLHRIKGETIRLRRPDGLGVIPILAGSGYIVPEGPTLLAGSTYEHTFDDLDPSEEGADFIKGKIAEMIPALREAELLEARAGARVKFPRSRYPVLDLLPGCERVWLFTALGSKGLLTAPLIASELPAFIRAPNTVPAPILLTRR